MKYFTCGDLIICRGDRCRCEMLRIFSIKESKVCIQLSLSIHQECNDEIRKNLPSNWRKTTFLNENVHNRGPKQLGKRRKENKFTKGTNQQEEPHFCHLFTKLLPKILCCPLSFLQLSKYLDPSFTRVSLP